jgi:hypothetical protein
LWASGELFVKLIVTVPAFAVSDDLVNFREPVGSAATESELLALLDGWLVDVAAVPDAVDELAAVLLADGLAALLWLPELPQAPTPSARTATTSVSLDLVITSHTSLLFDRLTR